MAKGADLASELEKVNFTYPTCTNFERDFPSVVGIATGVGKTRLMGAFITYLYWEKGIKNFFVMAPNLTIYNKLMDESHHYRAARGMSVINELNPILGLELTATPKTEQASKSVPFKNVVYEYSLAKAIRDGFVKQPAVATRKDFKPEQYKNAQEELESVIETGMPLFIEVGLALKEIKIHS